MNKIPTEKELKKWYKEIKKNLKNVLTEAYIKYDLEPNDSSTRSKMIDDMKKRVPLCIEDIKDISSEYDLNTGRIRFEFVVFPGCKKFEGTRG